jgi:hypothetical protein
MATPPTHITTIANPPHLPRRVLHVTVGLLLVCVAGWYGPWLTATGWRVFHPGGWVDYRGLRVRVPWPWIADSDMSRDDSGATPLGLGLKKLPQTLNHRLPPQSVFVTVISADPGVTAEQQTSQWMAMFRETHPGAEFSGVTPTAIPSGASCLRAGYPSKPTDIVWTCISVSGGWVANLEGHGSDEPAFFEVVGGLKR